MVVTERDMAIEGVDRVILPETVQLTRVIREGSSRGRMAIVGLAERNVADGFWVNAGGVYELLSTVEAIANHMADGERLIDTDTVLSWPTSMRFMEARPYPSAGHVDGLISQVERVFANPDKLAFGALVWRVDSTSVTVDERQLAVWRQIEPSGSTLERKLVNDFLRRNSLGSDRLVMDALRRRANERRSGERVLR